MINLAGNKNCDFHIESELQRAGIAIISSMQEGEVPASLSGELNTPYGVFTFRRAWKYWVVTGNLPLSLAQKLYSHPEGKSSVRVSGHCMCPPPEEWVEWIDKDGKHLGRNSELQQYPADSIIHQLVRDSKTHRFVDDPTKEGLPYITTYHIDDQAGLLLFSLAVQDKL